MDSRPNDKPWNELDLAELDAGWDSTEQAPPLPERISRFRLATEEKSKPLPRPSGRKPQWAIVGGLGLLIAGAIVGLVSRRAPALGAIETSVRASVTDTPSAEAAAPEAAPSSADSREDLSSSTRRVLVEIEPAGAQVYSGDERVGSDLVNIELVDGAPKELNIQCDGYVTRTVIIDGSRDFIHLELVPTPRPKRPLRHSTPRVATAPAVSSEAELAYP